MLSKEKIREWLTPGKIIPLLTALSAFVGNILGLFGLIQVTVTESIILLAIGLLAIDALTERLQILSRIETALQRIEQPNSTADDFLHSSYQHLPSLSEQLRSVKELWVSGTALSDLIVPNEDLLTNLVTQHGLKIKFLIVSPDSPLNPEIARMVYAEASEPVERFELSLKRTIIQLKDLMERAPIGQVEVRFTTRYPLFSLFIVDGDSPQGKLHVHLYNHTNALPTIFELKAHTDTQWYTTYVEEFRYLWNTGVPLAVCRGESANGPREPDSRL